MEHLFFGIAFIGYALAMGLLIGYALTRREVWRYVPILGAFVLPIIFATMVMAVSSPSGMQLRDVPAYVYRLRRFCERLCDRCGVFDSRAAA
jgi:hypothetical protein